MGLVARWCHATALTGACSAVPVAVSRGRLGAPGTGCAVVVPRCRPGEPVFGQTGGGVRDHHRCARTDLVLALLLGPPLTRLGPTMRRWRLANVHATISCHCEQRLISCVQEMRRCFLARYHSNVFSEGARTPKRRLPGKIFAGCIPRHHFSPLFTA